MIETKYILNPKSKKECDALHLRILKEYYIEKNEKDVHGRGKEKGYKYNTQWN